MKGLVVTAVGMVALAAAGAQQLVADGKSLALEDLDVSFAVSFATPGVKGPVTVVHATNMLSRAVTREGDALKVVWTGSAFAGKDFTVTAKLGTGAGDRPWSIEATGATCKEKLFKVDFPIVTRKFTPESEFFLPRSQGVVIRPDWKHRAVGAPFASYKMLMGHYAAFLEPGGTSWYVDIAPVEHQSPFGTFLRAGEMSASFLFSTCVPVDGHPVRVSGTYRPFVGSWYEAARIYATREHVKARIAAALRRGNPPALREIAMWMWNRGPKDNVLPPVVQFQKDSGCPAALDWYWWHAIPYDSGYPNFWPPRDGVESFRKAVAEANAAGVFTQVYVNGQAWDMDDPTFKQAGGEDEVIRLVDGTYTGIAFNRYDGHRLAYACGDQPRYKKLHQTLLANLHDSGLNGQYLDQIGCSLGKPCYSPTHGHPVGGSPKPGYRRQVAEYRRMFPGWPLCTEDLTEDFMDLFDSIICLAPSMETLGWISPEFHIVPAWAAVYHGVNTVFGNYAMIDRIPPFDPKWPDKDRWTEEKDWVKLFPDQFALDLVRGVVWGQQPSVHNFRLEHAKDPRLAADYKLMVDTAKFYYAHRDWLYDGAMLSPGELMTQVRDVKFMRRGIYTKNGEYREMTTRVPAVLHSCWQNAKGRKIAVLVNWTREPQPYELKTPDGQASGTLAPRTWLKVDLAHLR